MDNLQDKLMSLITYASNLPTFSLDFYNADFLLASHEEFHTMNSFGAVFSNNNNNYNDSDTVKSF